MNIKVFDGRADRDRLEKEIRVYDFLEELAVSFKRADHEPADNMEICDEIEKALDTVVCKNLFLCNRQQTAFYLLVMPGNKRFKTKELSDQINSSRLSFGTPEKMTELLDNTPGSASILGLMNDKENRVKLLIDMDVPELENMGFHPCINTSTLKLAKEDLFGRIIPGLKHEPQFVRLIGE